MRHAREIMELMEPYPGRAFKMIEIVRHVAGGRSPASQQEYERLRKGVRRVLNVLEEIGNVEREHPSAGNGGYSTFTWKPGHEYRANRDRNRDNCVGALRP